MAEFESIEVFQDLKIQLGSHSPAEVRAAIIACAKSPWRHAPSRETNVGHSEFVAFERDEEGDAPAVALVLWQDKANFHVSNIVPRGRSSLTYRQYNWALDSFHALVIQPAAATVGLQVVTTAERMSPLDWFSPEAAKLLAAFSACANKATGASHPSDEERWMAFLLRVYQEEHDGSYLARWLIEAEHWPDDIAHHLVSQYEFAMRLLARYDKSR